jgi:hypothetical protein
MVIAISGFLSENDDQKESWATLRSYCEEHEVPLFGVSWQAQTSDDVEKIANEGISTIMDNIKINKSVGMLSYKKFINVENAITLAKVAFKGAKETKALFEKARINAQISGKLLGHFIARNVRFDS